MMYRKIIVALDGLKKKEALKIAADLSGHVWGFKVTDLLFEDTTVIRQLKEFGGVFADAKLHDIPNTVVHSVKKLNAAGADLITVHASGGAAMMERAVSSARGSKMLAVTVLTSSSGKTVAREVTRLTKNALASGVTGIVCSGQDLKFLKNINGLSKLVKVVPGIRPTWHKNKDDQKRIITPKKAIQLGADFLVVGRPITRSASPKEAVRKILAEIKES